MLRATRTKSKAVVIMCSKSMEHNNYNPTDTPGRFEDYEEFLTSVKTINRFWSLESHNYCLMIASAERFDGIFVNMTRSQG